MIEKVFLVMGLFAFAKQAPKLISDVIGVDSGKMKLGIGGKLAAGGALGAAAMIGGAARAGINNFTHGIAKAGNKWKAVKDVDGFGKKFLAATSALGSSTFGLIGSTFAGAASGGARSIKGGFTAKNYAEAKKAKDEAFEKAMDKRSKRESYKANHGGFWGAMGGHISDATTGVGTWMGISASLKDLQAVQTKANEVKSARKAIDDRLTAILNKYKDNMTARSTVNATVNIDGYDETFASFDNYATLLNELEVMKSTGKMSDGRVATSHMITAMNKAEYEMKEQMKKDILEGYDLKGDGLKFANESIFNEKYDGELLGLVTDYRTKTLKNAKIISDNADKSIASVRDALKEYNEQAINNQGLSLYNFVTNDNALKLFEDSKNAINSATSSIDR